MTHIVPCEDPANDPEDWFIEKDGKQYPDDELASEALLRALEDRMPEGYTLEDWDAAVDRIEEGLTKAALVRRRHAKDKCHVECYFRTQCLGLALVEPNPPQYGTWGGYYQEELKVIRAERDRRRARQ